jgi:adenylate cyclase
MVPLGNQEGNLASEPVQRRLTAILAADVAGYSRLIGADEEGTLAQLKAFRKTLVDPTIAKHRGRIVKTTGDGMLVEFASAVDAARCAVEVQRGMAGENTEVPQAKRIEFRIGIHLGDIIIDDNDIFGDGVNIAARLESIAVPGGISISRAVHDQVRDRINVCFDDKGEIALKNIARPVQVFAISGAKESKTTVSPESKAALALPDKPSIAVLPFTNMSGDPEQEYFADGMAEDIITSLSRLKSLFVIARNSSFTYKGKTVDIKRVGQELGVRYVLEGSVRRAGDRLRITGQLIETATGTHIWADRWDCGLADIFQTQDEINARIENAIGDALVRSEAGRISRSGQANIQAWQLRIQAWEGFHRWHRQACLRGVDLGREAIRLDPSESDGYAVTASCLYALAMSGWAASGREAMNEAISLLSRAINLDADHAMAYTILGVCLLSVGRHDEAASQVNRGSELAPGSYYAAVGRGIVLGYCGEPQESLRSVATALRVSPRDPRIYATYQARCAPLFVLDRFEEVVSAAQYIMRLLPDWPEGLTMQAAALAKLGRTDEARHAIGRLLGLDSQYSVARALRRHPYRDAADRDKLADALRQAGLT